MKTRRYAAPAVKELEKIFQTARFVPVSFVLKIGGGGEFKEIMLKNIVENTFEKITKFPFP